jgi:hypothetical protein
MLNIADALIPRIGLMREAHGVYCTAQDNLRLTSWCSSAGVTQILVTGRFLSITGDLIDLSEAFTPATDRTLTTAVRALGEGWLLDLSIATNGSPTLGQAFVRAEIVRGFSGTVTPLKVLCQGRCNAVQRLAFPGSPIVTSIDGPGILRSITGTDPAAGAEISETVPAGARWRLHSLRATLTTDANPANRGVVLVFDDGVNAWGGVGTNFSQVASTAFTYNWGTGGQTSATTSPGVTVSMPNRVWLPAGARIRTATGAIQVGDNWSAPQYEVEEWLEGAA